MLSVIADSARVEVWYISQELLELLPLHVQNQIVNRLRKHQKIKIHNTEQSRKTRDYIFERTADLRAKADEKDYFSSYRMQTTGSMMQRYKKSSLLQQSSQLQKSHFASKVTTRSKTSALGHTTVLKKPTVRKTTYQKLARNIKSITFENSQQTSG